MRVTDTIGHLHYYGVTTNHGTDNQKSNSIIWFRFSRIHIFFFCFSGRFRASGALHSEALRLDNQSTPSGFGVSFLLCTTFFSALLTLLQREIATSSLFSGRGDGGYFVQKTWVYISTALLPTNTLSHDGNASASC